MSVKLYITGIQSNDDGTAITLFEDYMLQFLDEDTIEQSEFIRKNIADKIRSVKEINEQVSSPF